MKNQYLKKFNKIISEIQTNIHFVSDADGRK